MSHDCPGCACEPEPVIVETAPDMTPVADASVDVARIEADRDVAVAKVNARAIDEEAVAEMARLQARVDVLEAAAAPPPPPPAVIDLPPPSEPEPDMAPPKADDADVPSEPKPPARKRGFF